MFRLRIAFLMVVALLAAAAAACGSPQTAAGPTQSPQAAASVTAATSTPAPTPPSPPQALASVAPVAVTPQPAAEVGRSDCPVNWAGFASVSRLLSLCYPAPWQLNVSGTGAGYREALRLIDVQSGTFVGLSVVETTPMSAGTVPSLAALCDAFAKVSGIAFTTEDIRLGSLTGSACRGHGNAGEEGVDPIHGFVALPGGEYVQIYITRRSLDPRVDQVVSTLLATVRPR